MMTTTELAARLQAVMVQPPPLDARPRLAGLMRCHPSSGFAEVFLRYEWIKDWAGWDRLVKDSGWQLSDGQEWFGLFRPNEG